MMEKAVLLGYIQRSPLLGVTLPRIKKKEMQAISNDDVGRFLEAIKGHKYEAVFFVDIFSGLRQGELLGLAWDCVDFNLGTITVKKQLQRERVKGGGYHLVSLKNDDKSCRTFPLAPVVIDMLRHVKATQAQWKIALGKDFNNPMNLVLPMRTENILRPIPFTYLSKR